MENLLKPKRRKISVACDLCRIRKSKCDGNKPICGKCLRRKRATPCSYREDRTSSSLHDQPLLEQGSHLVDFHGAPGSTVDALPLATHLPLRENEGNRDDEAVDTGILGPSSAVSFATSILRLAKGEDPLARDRQTSRIPTNTSLRLSEKRKRYSVRGVQFVLPPRKIADRLMNIHWNYGHVMYPWLDRVQFEEQYGRLWSDTDVWSSSTMDEQVFHCILNIVFALSYKQDLSLSHQEQDDLAESHFSRAQSLLSFNLLEMAHLELVQALLMMAQYLQTIQKPSRCFSCVGLAIWVAQELGLPNPDVVSNIQNQHEREMAKRTWQGCILMDRITAMMVGRATRVSKDVASSALPPSTVEEIPYGVGIPSTLDFLLVSCSLYEILENVLSAFYRPVTPRNEALSGNTGGLGVFNSLSLETTLQLEDRLVEWKDGLPRHLQFESAFDDPTSSKIFVRQSMILRARYLNLRMLVFRPFFFEASMVATSYRYGRPPSKNRSHLSNSITAQCLRTLTETAQNLINHIEGCATLDRTMTLLLPWWQLSSYVYHACIVVIAGHLFLKLTEPITLDSLTASFEQGIQVLQQLEHERNHIHKFRHALQALYNAIVLPRTQARVSDLPNGALRPDETRDSGVETLEIEMDPGFAQLLSVEEGSGIEELFSVLDSSTWA